MHTDKMKGKFVPLYISLANVEVLKYPYLHLQYCYDLNLPIIVILHDEVIGRGQDSRLRRLPLDLVNGRYRRHWFDL